MQRTGGSRASILKFSGKPRQYGEVQWIEREGHLIVPILDRQRVGDSKPIAMDLEVCGLAIPALVSFKQAVFASKSQPTMRAREGPSALSRRQQSVLSKGIDRPLRHCC